MAERLSRARLQLGGELQTCRTLSGVNQRELATALGISQSLVSRVERGERLLSRPDTVKWLKTVRADVDARGRVLALVDAAHTETRTFADLGEGRTHLQDVVDEQDRSSLLIQDFSPTVLPGLLQTAEYARAVIPLADADDQFDHAAALAGRVTRQAILRERSKRSFQFLIAERLLSWEPGPGVLAPQLSHLAAAARIDGVEIAVLPERYAERGLPWHNFLIRHPMGGAPPWVAVELVHGEQIVTDPDGVTAYVGLWKHMWGASIAGDEAVELIRGIG